MNLEMKIFVLMLASCAIGLIIARIENPWIWVPMAFFAGFLATPLVRWVIG